LRDEGKISGIDCSGAGHDFAKLLVPGCGAVVGGLAVTTRLARLLIDAVDLLASAEPGEARWQAANQMIQRIGGNALNAGGMLAGSGEPYWLRSSMETVWLEEYAQAELYRVDPVLGGILQGRPLDYLDVRRWAEADGGGGTVGQLNEAALRFRHGYFMSAVWTQGGETTAVVLAAEDDPRDLFGRGTERTFRSISAVLAGALAGQGGNDQMARFGFELPDLTPAERDFLCFLAQGLETGEIAARMKLDPRALPGLSHGICEKLRVPAIEQALAVAMGRQMISL